MCHLNLPPSVAEEEDTTAGGPEEEEERGEAEDSGAEEVDNTRSPSVVEEREAPQEVEDEVCWHTGVLCG